MPHRQPAVSDGFAVVDEAAARLAGTGPGGPVPALVEGIDRWVAWSARVIVVGALTFLFCALFINVVLRYAFSLGIPWAYEIPAIMFPWLVIAGAVLAAQAGKHIAVEVLLRAVPAALRRALRILVNLVVLAAAVLVAAAAVPMMRASADSHLAVTGISQAWGYASLLYGYAMIAVTAATECYRLIYAPRGA